MPQQTDNDPRFLLVDESVLPEVFAKVVEAKDLLRSGRASTAAQAARLAGISRTAFYKYRDAVFSYDAGKSGGIVTVHLILQDNPGVLSALLAAFADAGANILTVNQNNPAGGVASVFGPHRPAGDAGGRVCPHLGCPAGGGADHPPDGRGHYRAAAGYAGRVTASLRTGDGIPLSAIYQIGGDAF